MACYWGFQTTVNKALWIICLTLGVVGIALLMAGAIGGSTGDKCFQLAKDCRDAGNDNSYCNDKYDAICKLQTWARLLAAGIIIFLVGGLLPTSWCCCCSKDPHASSYQATSATAVTGTYAQAPVAAQPYYPNHPVPTQTYTPSQPAMAQPYAPGPPVMAQPYAPGQPIMAQPYHPGQPVVAQPYYPPGAGNGTAPQPAAPPAGGVDIQMTSAAGAYPKV